MSGSGKKSKRGRRRRKGAETLPGGIVAWSGERAAKARGVGTSLV